MTWLLLGLLIGWAIRRKQCGHNIPALVERVITRIDRWNYVTKRATVDEAAQETFVQLVRDVEVFCREEPWDANRRSTLTK